MSCENWIVNDALLKKLVFQGLQSRGQNANYSLLDESDMDDEANTQGTVATSNQSANTSSKFGASNTSLPGTPTFSQNAEEAVVQKQPGISTPKPGILKSRKAEASAPNTSDIAEEN